MDLGATQSDPGCADIWPIDGTGKYDTKDINTMCSDAYNYQDELKNKNAAGNIEMQILGCFDPKNTKDKTATAGCKGTVQWPANLGEVDLKMNGADICIYPKNGT